MHDDQIRGLLRTLEDDRQPNPAFAEALYGRLQLAAGGERRGRGPMLLLAAALVALLAAGIAIGSGLVPLPQVVEATGTPTPSDEPGPTTSPAATATAEASPIPEVTDLAAGTILVADADGLHLRAEPSLDGEVLATLRSGQRLGATGATEGEWVEVRIGPGPLQGWVSSGADGSWLRRVTDGAIAFSMSGGTEGEPPTWWLAMPSGEAALHSLAGSDVIDLVWSPDGTRVAMTVSTTDSAAVAVEVAGADGGDRRRVGPGGYGPAWSPDGSRLAWADASGLVVTDTNLAPATIESGLRNVGNPIWSPDGTRLAVVAMDCPECPEDEPIIGDVPGAVYVVELPGGAVRKLTEPGYYALAGWSADGSRLSITTIDLSGERPQQAFMIPVDGGEPVALLGGGAVHEAPEWAPDGTRLAVATPDGIVVVAGDGSDARLLVASELFVGGVRWSPSGQWIVYQTAEDADIALWLVPLDGSAEPRRLTSEDVAAGPVEWQPVLAPLR